MKENKENTNKLKEGYKTLKEAWKDPRKKAGIKLLSYLIFFIIFFLVAAITSRMEISQNYDYNITTTTTTQVIDNYNDKQNILLTGKYNINYVIKVNDKEYKINGIINNKVIDGYLENDDNIKKIVFKDNNLYEIKNNQEVVLETEINNELINIEYIINFIKQTKFIKEQKENIVTYTYNIDDNNLKIVIESDKDNINKINVYSDKDIYEMIFDK